MCPTVLLREGLLYDLLGRLQHEDARERTVRAMAARYQRRSDRRPNGSLETADARYWFNVPTQNGS